MIRATCSEKPIVETGSNGNYTGPLARNTRDSGDVARGNERNTRIVCALEGCQGRRQKETRCFHDELSSSAIRTRGCSMQHWKLYASSPQQLLYMHSGVRGFLMKPSGNWPIASTCLREILPPVSLSSNDPRRSDARLRGQAEIFRKGRRCREYFRGLSYGNGRKKKCRRQWIEVLWGGTKRASLLI